MSRYIVFILVLILVFFVVQHYPWADGFADAPANDTMAKHQQYLADSKVKFDALTNTVNLTSPSIGIDPINAGNVQQALVTLVANPMSTGYGLDSVISHTTPEQLPGTIDAAQKCEAAPKTCGAFDDRVFAANCGMSFDPTSVNSAGQTVGIGGLYVSPYDRTQQTAAAETVEQTGSAPYDPYKVYQPTIGKAKQGTFGLTKDQCVIVKEKVDCAAKQTFGSPNCTQCYTSGTFSRVGPEAGKLPATLYLYGSGSAYAGISNGNYLLQNVTLSADTATKITLPPTSEGTTFWITVTSGSSPAYVSGYLEGPTPSGAFKVDLMSLVQSDTVTGKKPRITGSNGYNGFKCFTLMPGNGQSKMTLSCMMPFSFVNMFDGDALTCENGPIITRADSATFLESDPCYGKANQPGNYKIECLQTRWMELGGTAQGTGYPVDQPSADAIQRDAAGNSLDIDTIVNRLSVKMAQAQSGNDANGKPLSISDWNTVSMYAMGVPITNPCDGPVNKAGPVSKECASYLYANKGVNSRVGPTYTQLPSQAASSKEGFQSVSDVTLHEAFQSGQVARDVALRETRDVALHEAFQSDATPNTFNYPGTVIDPINDAGLQFAQGQGGVAAVQKQYDAINRLANDNTKSNTDRSTALKQAYNITLGQASSINVTGPTQVFAVGPNYQYTKDQADGVCAKYGATVATTAQLQDAYAHGADWCFSGWVADGGGKWPITTSVIGGCGGRTGIIEWTPPNNQAGVNCYGPKPGVNDPAATNGTIRSFNNQMWDQPTDPTYLSIPSGYLESTGPQPSCFSGASLDDAQKGCNALGSQCVGFSFSKDGAGNGCYKGNHNAGINANPAYMGYVKIPVSNPNSVITGRFIKLVYDRVECLNLSQIRVYSTKGGPNIITPNMWPQVTKSSGYEGDIFPVQNFVNGFNQAGVPENFVHTSCGDVPWIQVDLGAMTTIYKVVILNRGGCCQSRILGAKLQILNEENDAIYISNAVSSTNTVYTWLPPDPAIQVDVAEDMPMVAPKPMTFAIPAKSGGYYHDEWIVLGTITQGGTVTNVTASMTGQDQGWGGNDSRFYIIIQNSVATNNKWGWSHSFPRGRQTVSSPPFTGPLNVEPGDLVRMNIVAPYGGDSFTLEGGTITIAL